MKIILVADHASIDFGGEAALPCHYFRILLARNIDVCLVVHERSRTFLEKHFPDHSDRVYYVSNTELHKFIHRIQKPFPKRLSYITFGFVVRMLTQIEQKKIIKTLIQDKSNTLIHQVIPVSPKEPSLIYGFDVPVVFGPLNGGMSYPEGFTGYESRVGLWLNALGRRLSGPINFFFPGKREASLILVSNERTKTALPKKLTGHTRQVVDNGVDLALWKTLATDMKSKPAFVFVGRLIPLKGVDILIDAFFKAVEQYGEMTLHIIGDGTERHVLEALVERHSIQGAEVIFHGWMQQADISERLAGARALVLPSLHDCGGAVLLEAMACSIAVVATNWGGPADYLDETCGYLIDPTSREDLVNGFSAALVELAEKPELAQQLGISGRQKIEQEYDWERKIDEMITIYRDELEKCAD